MTVAGRGEREGTLAMIDRESGLNTDTPDIDLKERSGKITSNLKIGADITSVKPLMANDLISSPGVKLHGAGFIVTPSQAAGLGLGTVPGLEEHILPYRNGRDLLQRARGVMVIDLYPLTADEVRHQFPKVYQHVLEYVKPERDTNREEFRRNYWWWFGRKHTLLRGFLGGISKFIATTETSKHRIFQFLDAEIRPDNMLVCIGSDSSRLLAILSSRLHVTWMLSSGGTLEDRPRYNKTKIFDPMPFPLIEDAGRGPSGAW